MSQRIWLLNVFIKANCGIKELRERRVGREKVVHGSLSLSLCASQSHKKGSGALMGKDHLFLYKTSPVYIQSSNHRLASCIFFLADVCNDLVEQC